MENPLVSIITPVYNSASSLKPCIESVLNQSYENWELLIVNDASEDESMRIAESYSDKRIRIYRHHQNLGAAEARNLGTRNAKGDLIAFLDADDYWYAHKLERQLPYMKHVDVCFSSYDLMNEKGEFLGRKIEAHEELRYSKLLKANYIGNLTGIYNVKSLGRIYTKNLRKRQDWLLWLEALKRSDKPAYGIKESLAIYRIHSGSLSANKCNLIKHNFLVYRKGLGYSRVKASLLTLRFLFEQIFVKSRQLKAITSR